MSNTPNPTPTPPPVPTAPPKDSVRDALFKSLQLAVVEEAPNSSNAPTPDTGVEVPSTITDFSQKSGSVADMLAALEKPVVPPSVAPATTANPSPTPAPAPVAVTPAPVAPVVPAPTPEPTQPQLRKIEVPQIPTRTNDTVLPPPPMLFDMSILDDDEQNEVQNAIFAEQKYPERYPGLAKRVYDYIKSHREFVKAQELENPEVSFDENNQTYQKFIEQNRPKFPKSERRKLERERLLEEAASLAEKRLASKSKKLEDEIIKLRAEPMVQKTVKDYESMVKDLMPKDDDPLVEETAKQISDKAVNAGREFLLLANNLNDYNSQNPVHKWLGEFIQEQGDMYVKSNHASLKRGSRTFIPRAKYNQLNNEDRNKHFTFTDEDVLQLLAMNAKAATEFHVSQERERLKKAGYSRIVTPPAPPPTSTPPPVPPEPTSSPRASSSVAPVAPVIETRQTDPFLRYMGSR